MVLDKIDNDYSAVIENASVTSTGGIVNVTAKDESTLIGISAGIGKADGGLAGVGTVSVNIVSNVTEARVGVADPAAACVSMSATCSTTVSARGLNINATTKPISGRWPAAWPGAGPLPSVRRWVTRNLEHRLPANAAKIDLGTSGQAAINATSSSSIQSASVAIAVGGQTAIAGSLDWNIIGDDVKAEVTRSAITAHSLSVSADQGEGIDKAAIYSLSGAGAGVNINDIDNRIEAYITNSALFVPGAVNVTSATSLNMHVASGSGSRQRQVRSGRLASAANTITNTVNAGITNSSLIRPRTSQAFPPTTTPISAGNCRPGAGNNAGSLALLTTASTTIFTPTSTARGQALRKPTTTQRT